MRLLSAPLWGLAALVGIILPAGAADSSVRAAKERAAARKLSVTKCVKCHKFYHPDDYSPADWEKWMESMGRKSKLKPKQYETISRYLASLRTTNAPPRDQ